MCLALKQRFFVR